MHLDSRLKGDANAVIVLVDALVDQFAKDNKIVISDDDGISEVDDNNSSFNINHSEVMEVESTLNDHSDIAVRIPPKCLVVGHTKGAGRCTPDMKRKLKRKVQDKSSANAGRSDLLHTVQCSMDDPLSEIKLPERVPKCGRPKGVQLTAIRLPKKRLELEEKPIPYIRLHSKETERVIIQ
ncbi:uncharacterized protein LOC141904977 isoform X2 [Tubulanus polymorphus]